MHEFAPEQLYPEHVAKTLRACVDQVKTTWRPSDDQRFNDFLIALYHAGTAWPAAEYFRRCLVFGGFEKWLCDYHIKRLTVIYASGETLLKQFENIKAPMLSDAAEFKSSYQASFNPVVQPTEQFLQQQSRPTQPR